MNLIQLYTALIVVCSELISAVFFNSVFDRKVSFSKLIAVNLICGLFTGAAYLLQIPILNLAVFFAANYIFVNTAYKCNKITVILYILILEAVMMLSEYIFVIFYHFALGVETELLSSDENAALFSTLSKSLYLIIILIARKIFMKKKASMDKDNTYYFFLSVPLAVIILLCGMYFVVCRLSSRESVLFMFSVLPLMVLEFACCIVYDYIIERNKEILMLKEINHQNVLKYKDYLIYKQKYEDSRIFIHDIKKHFSIIKELGTTTEKAQKYMNEYMENCGIEQDIIYTDNDILNIILNENSRRCAENNIDFSVNIATNRFNDLSDSDIAAIFCNLLDNAFESSKNSEDKTITVDIYLINKSILTINIVNSCDEEPKLENKNESDTGSEAHGIGMQSIEKAVSRYNGEYEYFYNKDKRTFESVIYIFGKVNISENDSNSNKI